MFIVMKILINLVENFFEIFLGFWFDKLLVEYILNVFEVIIVGWVLF